MRKPGVKLFTIGLTDDERAKLEAHRVRLGLRSQTDVVRGWINNEADPPRNRVVAAARMAAARMAAPGLDPVRRPLASKPDVDAAVSAKPVSVQLPVGNIRKPMQKSTKK